MPERYRIVVTGLAATYPFGGVFWDYMQYVLGFHRLGHDVLYLEDTGKWVYDPDAQTFVESGRTVAEKLARNIAVFEPALSERWYYRDARNECFGRSRRSAEEFCRTADLFLHISASCWFREEYRKARVLAFIDSDPMYTQASVPPYVDGTLDEAGCVHLDEVRAHHVFFTFAENIGGADCKVPRELFDWAPTRQPIVMDVFEGHRVDVSRRRRVLTTVASWEPTEKGPVIRGVEYGGKSTEFRRFIDLPSRSPVPLEVAISGPPAKEILAKAGWNLVDGLSASRDPWVYRDYLADSLAELSVAKNAYAAGRTGWFSCRTACYLALGVPAIVQDTGFSKYIPCGQGVLTFETLDQAAAAIEAVLADPQRHASAAIDIAREYFDSSKVLRALLDRAMRGK